jgi:hypothetical protein
VETDNRRILYLEEHDSRIFTTLLLKGTGYQVTSTAWVVEAQTLIDQSAGVPSFDPYIRTIS